MHSNFSKVLIVLFLSVIISCQKGDDEDLNPEKVSSSELSIGEAKSWFLSQYAGARMAGSKVTAKPLFDYAAEYKFTRDDKQKYVILPIFHESSDEPSSNNGFKQLWIYKDADKNKTMRIMEFIYDNSMPKNEREQNTLKNFTGTMLIRTWENKPLGGFLLKNGKIVKGFHIKQESPNGRIRGTVCGFTTSYRFWSVNVPALPEIGTFWHVEETTDYKCVVTQDLDADPPACEGDGCEIQYPEPGTGGGNSGAGSTDPNEIGITTPPTAIPFGTYTFKFSVMGDPCSGRSEMLRAQNFEGKEISGLLTTTGRVIVLPSQLNSRHQAYLTLGLQNDVFGRPSIWFGKNDNTGAYEVTVYYYQNPSMIPTSVQTHTVAGTIHTHPQDTGYDWDNPSAQDQSLAGSLSGLSHYVFHGGSSGFFKYDKDGNRTTTEMCGVHN